MNVRELRSLLGTFDPEAIVTVRAAIEPTAENRVDFVGYSSPFTVVIAQSERYVTEEDLA